MLAAERGELDPLSITADTYDLVCNGVELSSGAVRNHDPDVYKRQGGELRRSAAQAF